MSRKVQGLRGAAEASAAAGSRWHPQAHLLSLFEVLLVNELRCPRNPNAWIFSIC